MLQIVKYLLADDTTIYFSHEDLNLIESVLQNELCNINNIAY